jgi:quinol-cytochrome oxidoreductase complex cytochrome b subunit
MIFLNNYYFMLLVLVPVLIFLFLKSQKSKSVKFKFIEDIKKVFPFSKYLFFTEIVLVSLILGLFILVLANPNKTNIKQNISKN